MWCGRENSSAVHGGNRCESTGVCRRGFVSRILTHTVHSGQDQAVAGQHDGSALLQPGLTCTGRTETLLSSGARHRIWASFDRRHSSPRARSDKMLTVWKLRLVHRKRLPCEPAAGWLVVDCRGDFYLEVLEVDILWPRWVARIGVTRSTEACFLTADRQCTELPLLRLPRLVPEFRGSGPMRQTRDLARVGWRGLAARKGCVRSRSP